MRINKGMMAVLTALVLIVAMLIFIERADPETEVIGPLWEALTGGWW